MDTSAVAEGVTSHVGVAGTTGKAVELLPPGCSVPRVQGGGERDPAWVIFCVGDAISVEVYRREDGARCNEAEEGEGGGVPRAKQEDDRLVDGTVL